MPELHDTDDEIVCPICHGKGKTTGKAIFAVIDGLLGYIYGRLTGIQESIHIDMHKTFMRRLWNAQSDAE